MDSWWDARIEFNREQHVSQEELLLVAAPATVVGGAIGAELFDLETMLKYDNVFGVIRGVDELQVPERLRFVRGAVGAAVGGAAALAASLIIAEQSDMLKWIGVPSGRVGA